MTFRRVQCSALGSAVACFVNKSRGARQGCCVVPCPPTGKKKGQSSNRQFLPVRYSVHATPKSHKVSPCRTFRRLKLDETRQDKSSPSGRKSSAFFTRLLKCVTRDVRVNRLGLVASWYSGLHAGRKCYCYSLTVV